MQARIVELERRLTSLERRRAPVHGGSTIFESVRCVLAERDDWMTVGDIADAAQIATSAVRMVLYSSHNKFEKMQLSPRRVLWRLRRPLNCALSVDNLAHGHHFAPAELSAV